MGYRTLSPRLVLRALLFDPDAYDRLRDDDNPFIEGLFLIILIGFLTALLSLIGQLITWASTPDLNAMKAIVLEELIPYFERMPWWSQAIQDPAFLETFQRNYDLGWLVFPSLFGAPNPLSATLNLLLWPLQALASWLIYGVLAFAIGRLLHGQGTLNETLGTSALAATPLLLRGLGVIPFLAIGGVIATWQLICRYQAVRSAHRLSWDRAFWTTVLPYAAYLLVWLVLGAVALLLVALLAGR